MQPMSREDDDQKTYAYARKLESDFSNKYHELDKRITILENRLSGLEDKLDDICHKLQKTEVVLNTKLDMLLADHHKRQGVGMLAAWLPSMVSVIVGAIAIYSFIIKP